MYTYPLPPASPTYFSSFFVLNAATGKNKKKKKTQSISLLFAKHWDLGIKGEKNFGEPTSLPVTRTSGKGGWSKFLRTSL